MNWLQRTVQLPPRKRGFHLISRQILDTLPELKEFEIGLLHLFIQHTSASLTINENADPDVPHDLETSFDAIAPEDFPYRHSCEGPDDMPAHVKASLLGNSVSVPVRDGRLCLGTWQGIYLCEHRERAARLLVLRQRLPLALEDRERRRMEGVAALEAPLHELSRLSLRCSRVYRRPLRR